MKVKLIRGVFIGHTPHKAADEINVSDAFGRELIAMQKAELVTGEAAARGPMTTESAGGLVAPKAEKGGAK